MLCILFCSTCVVRDFDFDVLRKILCAGTVLWSCANLRQLATTSDKSTAVKFCCPVPHNILYVFFILVLLTVCKIFIFHVLFFDSLLVLYLLLLLSQ